jgi:hypothetical protein
MNNTECEIYRKQLGSGAQVPVCIGEESCIKLYLEKYDNELTHGQGDENNAYLRYYRAMHDCAIKKRNQILKTFCS